MAAENKSFKLNPTFTLFRIDPAQVKERYLNGYYDSLRIPNPNKDGVGAILGAKKIFNTVFGTNSENEIFSYRDRAGCEVVVATAGAAHPERKSYRCHYCRCDFSHEPVGIVVAKSHYYEKSKLCHILHTINEFNNWSCALAYIREHDAIFRRLYPNARADTVTHFHLCHPDVETLVEANDWRLLDVNGGPLSYEVWAESDHRYLVQPDIMVCRARIPFVRDKV